MFEQINWTDYLITIGSVTAGYYVLIGGLFFRREISELMNKSTKWKPKRSEGSGISLFSDAEAQQAAISEQEEVVEEVLEEVNQLMDRLQEVMLEVTQDTSKADLLSRIAEALKGYTWANREAYSGMLGELIVSQGKEICGVVISEKDLDELWRSLPR